MAPTPRETPQGRAEPALRAAGVCARARLSSLSRPTATRGRQPPAPPSVGLSGEIAAGDGHFRLQGV